MTNDDMTATAVERDRKAEHIHLALDSANQVRQSFFDDYAFEHNALPELAMGDIDTSVEFLGKRLDAPILVSCMTGGTEEAAEINRNLARAAETCRIALGVGSQRKALEDPLQASSFQVRDLAPSVPLLANLGAVQLNYGYGIDECRAAVEMIDADALAFHLNVLQEAIQPEGQTDFGGLLPKMGAVAEQLEVPVIAKEIGCGISGNTARALAEHGIRIIDTAGLGGTSWARIEARRAGDVAIGEMFADWGIPSPDAIRVSSAGRVRDRERWSAQRRGCREGHRARRPRRGHGIPVPRARHGLGRGGGGQSWTDRGRTEDRDVVCGDTNDRRAAARRPG
jgi:isopentenyl-diphosphate delta-isomerase